MATLAEIRARLKNEDNKRNNFQDNAVYPHWNIPEGSSARLRFLPDGDDTNDLFWVERQMIRLPFNGIKGQIDSREVTVQVPCAEMWPNMSCPILTEARLWFKDPSLEDMGRKYWKKRSYVFQGFVRENPLSEDNVPENPIRRFVINPQIFTLIKAALMDVEIEVIPTDYERGLDFSVVKETKGKYADYTASKWSRKESALTAVEKAAIENYGLFNLSEFLPSKPTDDELRIIQEMFEASVDGQPYDPEKWGSTYKPYGLDLESRTSPQPQSQPQSSKVDDDENDENEEDETTTTSTAADEVVEEKPETNNKAEEILAMIRNRQKTSS